MNDSTKMSAPSEKKRGMPFVQRIYLAIALLSVAAFIWGSGQPRPMPAAGYILIPAAMFVYLLPALVAAHRAHPSQVGIFALNLFLGWSFLGWVVSLVWALSAPKTAAPVVVSAPSASAAEELGKLAELRDKGVLTDEEFEKRKKTLLS